MFEGRAALRPLHWLGRSRKDYSEFPVAVQETCGFALYLAQRGQYPLIAKPLKGMGSGVSELVADFDGDTHRTVYVVRFARAVYVLHAFKKKSKSGIKTPQPDLDLIRKRLGDAEAHYRNAYREEP